jgi:hypothetical protein
MNGYENGKIYKIVGSGLTYYGSTIQTLEKRLQSHKTKYKGFLEGNEKYYLSSFEILQLEDYKMELVEAYPCSSKKELELREKHYITSFDCCNSNVPRRTVEEYREEYRETNKQAVKKYREANKEVIKKYYDVNKEAIKKHQKEYYQANKEAVLKRQKENYQANKEAVLKRQKERYQAKKVKVIN